MLGMKKSNTGSDFTVGAVEVCDGFYIDDKLRINGILYLENKYGVPFNEIPFGSGKINEIINLIIALAIQRDHNLTEEKAIEKLKELDIKQIIDADQKLSEVFGGEVKN